MSRFRNQCSCPLNNLFQKSLINNVLWSQFSTVNRIKVHPIKSLTQLRQAGNDVTALKVIRSVAGDAVDDRRAIWLSLAHLVRSMPDQNQSNVPCLLSRKRDVGIQKMDRVFNRSQGIWLNPSNSLKRSLFYLVRGTSLMHTPKTINTSKQPHLYYVKWAWYTYNLTKIDWKKSTQHQYSNPQPSGSLMLW